jgi:hypothetical protein
MRVLDHAREAPPPVTILGVITFLGGVCAAVNIVWALIGGRISLDLGIIWIWVGPGLIAGSSAWRIVAISLIWLVVAGTAAVLIYWGINFPEYIGMIDEVNTYSATVIAAIVTFVVLAVAYLAWSLWVLYKYEAYFQH